MGPLEQDSLFSLEVIVDSLRLRKSDGEPARPVVCRFPAVAFRLLDFPTLIIYDVEPDLGDTIKRKIRSDPYYVVPDTLPELQDKHGDFILKKGKSCLFKISASALNAHLMSTPLYVMLIDTYPDVPKLVASCYVPLDGVMSQLFNDVKRQGISVPSVQGLKGKYKLCDLMGREIGQITAGMRLLSLGVGLMQHIPPQAIASRTDKIGSSNKHDKGPAATLFDINNMEGVEESKKADHSIQVSIRPDVVATENMYSQTDQQQPPMSMSTQTEYSANSQKRIKQKDTDIKARLKEFPRADEEIDDLFLTNSYCPPPMFFNSKSERKTGQSILFSHYPQGLPMVGDQSPQGDESSDEGTIREEDRFSESDDELFHPGVSKLVPKRPALKYEAPQKPSKKDNAAKLPIQHLQKLASFPILNALLQEVFAMQETGSTKPGQHNISSSPPKQPAKILPSRTHGPAHSTKESTGEFLARISSPKSKGREHLLPQTPGSPSHKHHSCVAPDVTVPQNKSWLRLEPSCGVRKTKLTSGMTNTQRLRLAKTNPKLLIELEKEEEERLENRRQRALEKWGPPGTSTSTTEKPFQQIKHLKEHAEDMKKQTQDVESKIHRKPIPTPRQSISLSSKDPSQSPIPRLWPKSEDSPDGSDVEDYYHHDQMTDAARSQFKNADVHLQRGDHTPPGNAVGKAPSTDKENDSSVFGKTRLIHAPRDARKESIPGSDDLDHYSDDFEDQSPRATSAPDVVSSHEMVSGEVPDLRCVVDRYSDDSDDAAAHPDRSLDVSPDDWEQPQLRRIVERYSSEEEERSESNASYRSAASHVSQTTQNSGTNNSVSAASDSRMKPNISDSPRQHHGNHGNADHQPGRGFPFPRLRDTFGQSVSPDSTAYIPRSQIPSHLSTGSSITEGGVSIDDQDLADSGGRVSGVTMVTRPKPSPRTPRYHKTISVHTDSISSNEPPSEMQPSFDTSEDDYKDYMPVVQPAKSSRVVPEAKLGYTWGL